MQMSSNKKIAAVVLTTVALSIGTVGVASASQGNSKLLSLRTISTKTTVNAVGNRPVEKKMGGVETELATVFAALVAKGTITQTQSDAITAALTTARAAHDAKRGEDQAANDAQRAAHEALVASTIGIDAATIKTRLAAGETLGVIAGAKKSALIAALVAEATKNIDASLAAGKITAAQATTIKAGLTAHITSEVDEVRGAMAPGKGKGGPMGGRGPGEKDGNHGKGMKP